MKILPYILILVSDLLFASQFLITRIYSRRNKGGLVSSLSYSIGTNATAIIYMLFVLKFRVEFSLFTVIVALIYALLMVLLSYCANAALRLVNLSLYSLFNMLGAVALSVLFGFLVFAEKIEIGTAICILLVIVALAVGAEYRAGKKGAAKYYIACFFLNGITGAIVKTHKEPQSFAGGIARIVNTVFRTSWQPNTDALGWQTTSDNNFYFFTSLLSLAVSALVLLIMMAAKRENTFKNFADPKNLACMGGYGVVHGIAQLLAFYTMDHIALSLQQPLTTGGVIAFTFLICVIIRERQSKKDIIAFVFACLSMVAIVLNYVPWGKLWEFICSWF